MIGNEHRNKAVVRDELLLNFNDIAFITVAT